MRERERERECVCVCVCVVSPGCSRREGPGVITFRSLLTKVTYTEPNDLQCNPSSDSSAQKGKELGRPSVSTGSNSNLLTAQEDERKVEYKIK